MVDWKGRGGQGLGSTELVPFFSGAAEGSGVASSDWSVGSGWLMLSCSFSSAIVGGICKFRS